MSAEVRRKTKQDATSFPEVHLKPGIDNLLKTLQAVVDGKLPITSVNVRLDTLRNWAHGTGQQDGEIYGLVVKNTEGKGGRNGQEGKGEEAHG